MSIPGKIYGNSGMVHFTEINQDPSPYSMLQYIGRVATPKLLPRKLSQILANNIDNGGRGIGLRIYVRYCRVESHYPLPSSLVHWFTK